MNDFASLGLVEPLLRAVSDAGYTQPTPVQLKAIPLVLAGGDLLAGAQTGTGKTAGFTLPILQRLSANAAPRRVPGRPRCLVLTPTRELAAQVEESVRTYGRYLTLDSMVMFGGVNIKPQIDRLRRPVDILVATPGRLLDHYGQRTLDLSGIEILVLDEADRMLDMGFIRDIRKILALLPKHRQNLLFSATFSNEIRALADGLLHKPGSVDVAPRNATSDLVEQSVHLVEQNHKRDLLSHLIRHNDWRQVLVFTRTKHGANRLAEKLIRDGIAAAAIHGNKSQSARTQALAGFKDGSLPVLVATDIAARGLDIDQLPRVVNFELPHVPEDYVHRIGRTGRAGSTGAAVSLVDAEEIKLLKGIERLIRREITRVDVEGFVPPVRIVENSARDTGGRDARRGSGPARSTAGDTAGRDSRSPRRSAPRRGNGNNAAGQARPGGPRRDGQPASLFTAPKPGSTRGRG
ncbi:DEAD/DEAH box helicase [Methylotetracoccus oryzae]|uniref:DEAD/DEAH box helicase n=1 Tax=Methylotetracoccus oryzae TaxID=1919059 RepID=UPI001F24E872|nr:DEAD/DEAH box helicase [Methylotetracoccus oryzae]